jgi:hypothetical protein
MNLLGVNRRRSGALTPIWWNPLYVAPMRRASSRSSFLCDPGANLLKVDEAVLTSLAKQVFAPDRLPLPQAISNKRKIDAQAHRS